MKVSPLYLRYGGKITHTKRILRCLPPHDLFIDLFAGSASVLLNKPRTRMEIANDLDPEVVNCLRVAQFHPQELQAALCIFPYGKMDFGFADPVQRAAAFCARSVYTFSGQDTGDRIAFDYGKALSAKNVKWSNWHVRVPAVSNRLRDVQILQLDAVELLDRYKNDPSVLVYADPPYRNHEHEYKYKVDYEEFMRLALQCKCNIVISELDRQLDSYLNHRWYKTSFTSKKSSSLYKTSNTEALYRNFPVANGVRLGPKLYAVQNPPVYAFA